MSNNQCTICGKPGIPGLIRGAGKCQYHWNVGAYGQEWADECEARQCAPWFEPIPRQPNAQTMCLLSIGSQWVVSATAKHVQACNAWIKQARDAVINEPAFASWLMEHYQAAPQDCADVEELRADYCADLLRNMETK